MLLLVNWNILAHQNKKVMQNIHLSNLRYGFLVLFVAVSVLIPGQVKGCTAFVLQAENQFVLAKNLDWPVGEGMVFVNKRGVKKSGFSCVGKRLNWTAKYGSVTFNQFGKEFPLGGMNETGMVIEELNSWGEVPDRPDVYKLNEFQWIQYCLDNFASVEELINFGDSLEIAPIFINLHYMVCDSKGQILIVEFYEGQAHFFTGDDIVYPVLSNNHYLNSVKYTANFEGFGGELPLRNDLSSNSRFVKCASMIKALEPGGHMVLPTRAFEILNTVKQADTQWSIVYDVPNKIIRFRIASQKKDKKIDLGIFDFSCDEYVLYHTLNSEEPENWIPDFKTFDPRKNLNHLSLVFEKLRAFDLTLKNKSFFLEMARFGNSVTCGN
jgi:penicillin V acylase-like amidase (Ntn superfamily)